MIHSLISDSAVFFTYCNNNRIFSLLHCPGISPESFFNPETAAKRRPYFYRGYLSAGKWYTVKESTYFYQGKNAR
jgi:hypothetical protein